MTLETSDEALSAMDIPTELLAWVADNAQAFDTGDLEVSEALSRFATAGLVDLGAPFNNAGQLLHQATAIELLARGSFSAAFALWGHRMVIEFLTLAGGEFADAVLPQLRSGAMPGASAMAPGYKALAGIGNLGLRVTRSQQEKLQLSGRIAWASNLYPNGIVVAPSYGPDAPADVTGTNGGVVVAVPLDSPGVTIGPPLDLLAMKGTASTTVLFEDVPLHDAQILTTNFVPFLQKTRPTLSILQASFCVGLGTVSEDQARANTSGINEVYAQEIAEQGERLRAVKAQLVDVATRVGTAQAPTPHEVLGMRLVAGQTAAHLAHLELKTAGGRGFITTSATNRRYRESTFIPLQSPSEGHLQWELERLCK